MDIQGQQVRELQFQQFGDVSDPTVMFVPENSGSRASKKTGLSKKYQCQYCKIKPHHSKKKIIKHKQICPERKEIKKTQQEDERQGAHLNNMIENVNQEYGQLFEVVGDNKKSTDRIEKMEKQISELKGHINKIVNTRYLTKDFDIISHAKQMTALIFADTEKAIVETLKLRLNSALQQAIRAGIQISKMISSIGTRIMSKMSGINFSDLIYGYNENLSTAHNILQEQAKTANKSSRTIADNNRAKKYLERYSSFDFNYQGRIITDLLKLSHGQRLNILRYYKMLKKYTNFRQYPDLPQLDSKLPFRKMRPQVEMGQVTAWVEQLYAEKRYTLACDVWAAVCMGLRSPELKRVYFINSEGQPIRTVKIRERKNNNNALRYVPNSLINLLLLTNTPYPISEERFNQARSECLQQFHTFYGFRHLCITSIVTALYKSSGYAQFHKRASTTEQYYLRNDSKQLIDEMFNLNIPNHSSTINIRTILLDFTCDPPAEKFVEKINVTIDSTQDVIDQIQKDCILAGDGTANQLSHKNYTKEDLFRMQSSALVFANHQEQLDEDNLSFTLGQCLAKMSDDMLLFELMMDIKLNMMGWPHGNQYIVTAAAMIYQKNILAYDFTNKKQKPIQINSQVLNTSTPGSGNSIVIAFYQEAFLSTNNFHQNGQAMTTWQKEIAPLQKQERAGHQLLSHLVPRCHCSINKSQLDIRFDANSRGYLFCFSCRKSTKQVLQSSQIVKCQQISIKPLYSETINHTHLSIPFFKTKNNLQRAVQHLYGRNSYSKKMSYSASLPRFFTTSFRRFSEHLSKQFIKNRNEQQYLPLQVRNTSSGHDKQSGVFSLSDLSAGSLVLTYCAVVSSSHDPQYSQDCFHLGWLSSKQFPRQVVLVPTQRVNAGCLVRKVSEFDKTNCSQVVGMLNSEEIGVYFYTRKALRKGDQLISYDCSQISHKFTREQKEDINSIDEHDSDIY